MKNCTYVVRTLLICVFVFAGMTPGFSQQIEKGFTSSTGDYLGFLEYKPTDYAQNTTTKYPLIIFLHGIGERGNGTTMLQDVTCCGIPRIIRLGHKMKFTWNGKTETFLVLSPQCPEKYGMWPAVFITELINYAKNNLRIDPNRIYLTGLSMGGGGTFRFISTGADQPKQLAAAATICAPCTFSQPLDPVNAHLPIWSFHAADDPTASVTCTLNAINRINDFNPNPKPLLTIWPTGGHIVWDRVYTDTNYRYDGVVNIYEWFLGQNKSLPINIMPVARAGNTINITTGTATAKLDASASTDADGKLVRYVWRKISGPTAGVITTPFGTASSTTVTGLTLAGTYQYQLNVVDDRAAVSRDTLTVIVSNGASAENVAPVAKAGTDVTITLPTNSVTLNGSASSDADGTIAAYSWTKVSGGAAAIASPTAASTQITGLVEGTYVFKLKVTDNKGATGEDQITVVVNPAPNKAPVAKAGTDVTITLPVNSVSLNGSGSTDSDGTITSYSWTKVSGGAATIVNPSAAFTAINGLVEGTYVFKLKVTDNDGATGEDQLTVIVKAAANVAPVAKAGTDITITLPANNVTLNGSSSSDGDGTIASYAWTKVSGPAATIASASSATTAVSGLLQGTYVFKLRVTDNDGATAEDQVTVVVNPAPNAAPVAKAGADITITLPVNTVTLNGTSSSDGDGTITSYAWTKVSGPAATIASASSATTSVNGLVQGTYVFKLKVTDNDGATAEDQITVVVNAAPNAAPVAKAGADITITLPVNTVTLNGSSSSDGDGTITSYSWTKISGPAATIASASSATTAVNGLVQGTYIFKLRVTDNDGAIGEDQVTVKVNAAPNNPPTARAGNDITITLPTNRTTLSGVGSSDADGSIVSYAWAKLSGPTQFVIGDAAASLTSVTNLIEGTYTFRLVVTDDKGATDADTVVVKVLPAPPPPNVRPVAEAGANQNITLPDDAVTLDGSKSTDADGSITSYAWSFISGPSTYTISNATSAQANVTNLGAGTYQFKLVVTDNDGATDADTIAITVAEATTPPPPPNVAPHADAGNDFVITLPVNQVTLNGSASEDSDGTIASYKWNKISGPSSLNIVSSASASTLVENLVEGVYSFQLLVKDNDGALSTDTVKVTVLPAPNETPASDAGPDQQVKLPDPNIQLDGTDSYDPDGTVEGYRWEQVSGPSTATISSSSTAITSVTNVVEGSYVFRLTVTDNDGTRASDVVKITVLPADIPNVAPVADAGEKFEVTLPANGTALNGSGSHDNDGTIVDYSWVKVSGPGVTIVNSNTSSPGIVGLEEGTYVFRLTVTDDDGEASSDEVTVIVHAAVENKVPVANAGADKTISYPDTSVTISGGSSTDQDGNIASYSWQVAEGPSTPTIMNPSSPSTVINNLQTGDYVFVLIVTDDKGAVATDTVRVSVINTQRFTEAFTVYPNPARSDVQVQLTSDTLGATRISVYNSSGMLMQSINTDKSQPTLQTKLNISNLQTGLYYLEVIVAGKERKITKFIKQQ